MGGAKVTGRGTKRGPKAEGPTAGIGFLGREQRAPSPPAGALGVWGSAVISLSGVPRKI